MSAMPLTIAGSSRVGLLPSRSLRSALTGAFCLTKPLALSRSMRCSSVSRAMALFPLLMVEQAKHALGDDVVLDLGGAAEDRHRLVTEEGAGRFELRLREAFAFP